MKTYKFLLLLGACLAAQCQAQSFGDIFRSAANSAASSAASSAADQAARGLVNSLVDKVKGGNTPKAAAQNPADDEAARRGVLPAGEAGGKLAPGAADQEKPAETRREG